MRKVSGKPERFPSGMKALADYVHNKGLKFGIYSDAGGTTCAGYPGSRGHEYQDAKTYAAWGVDYLKYDWCDTKGLKAEGAYMTMRDAIYATGRPMLFSICEWGDNDPWEWAKDIGHSWRTTGDIYACWDCEHDHLVLGHAHPDYHHVHIVPMTGACVFTQALLHIQDAHYAPG